VGSVVGFSWKIAFKQRGCTPWAVKDCGRAEFIVETSQFPRNKGIQDDNPRKDDGELPLR